MLQPITDAGDLRRPFDFRDLMSFSDLLGPTLDVSDPLSVPLAISGVVDQALGPSEVVSYQHEAAVRLLPVQTPT